jgi:hypothetical protein
MLNPGGLKQYSTTVDDATKSGTYDSAISSGQLYITDGEFSRLLGEVPTAAQTGAFTIRPYHEPDAVVVYPWT